MTAAHPTEGLPVGQLTEVAELHVEAATPWNFRHTLWKPSHFRTDLEVHTRHESWRTLWVGAAPCGIHMIARSSGMTVRVFSDERWTFEHEATLNRRVRHSYGFDDDLTAFLNYAEAVPAVRMTLRELSGMRLSCPESPFEIAIISLLLQNTTVARTTQMLRNLLDNYGSLVSFDVAVLRLMFRPERLERVGEQELRTRDRLGYRAKVLPGFAAHFTEFHNELVDESDLQQVRGIGPYTAGVIASHANRSFAALGLDVWNTRIIGRLLLDRDTSSQAEVRTALEQQFPGCAGLAAAYLVEHELLPDPVVPLLPDRAAVREAGDVLVASPIAQVVRS